MRAILSGYVLVMISIGALYAQDRSAQSFFVEGDSLRRTYRFAQAMEAFQKAIDASSDTLFLNRAELNMILCENGLNMLQYAVDPKVLGSAAIPRESFYLYLNLDPHSFWVMPPMTLFPEISGDYPAFVSPSNGLIVFTGKTGRSGDLNLYLSRRQNDTLWSYPQLMEPTINSSGNECYPVLSADGQTLWFASDGHYGMGGFDLYVSYYNQELETWSQAQNMGFPYSSTDNDLAFMSDPDGLSAFIVSDRGEDNFSFHLYKVGYELNPERYDWRNRLDLTYLAQLGSHAQANGSKEAEGDLQVSPEQNGLENYSMLVQSARKIRDEVTAQERKLVASREQYAKLAHEQNEEVRAALAKRIEEEEWALMELREKFRITGIEVQKVETEFLAKGILPPIEPMPLSKAEPAIMPLPFVPQTGSLGSLDSFAFAPPVIKEEPVDLLFRIEKVSQIIVQDEIPNYLFYGVQLSASAVHEKAATFKGVSPIFESKTEAGKYRYTAGRFNSHTDASRALAQIQRLGFKNAFIVAFYQGKSVMVAAARQLEAAAPKASYRLSLGSYPKGLPESLSIAVKELCNKDLAIVAGEGGAKYVVGPFGTMQEVQALQRALTDLGYEAVFIEIINP